MRVIGERLPLHIAKTPAARIARPMVVSRPVQQAELTCKAGCSSSGEDSRLTQYPRLPILTC